MSANIEQILAEARQLPIPLQHELVHRLHQQIEDQQSRNSQSAATIVEETFGSMRGLDRETIIRLAEDEEFCGY
jgi:hypothetical protein